MRVSNGQKTVKTGAVGRIEQPQHSSTAHSIDKAEAQADELKLYF